MQGIVLVSELNSGRARHPKQLSPSQELYWLSLPQTRGLTLHGAPGSGLLKAITVLVTPLGFPGFKTKLKHHMEHFASFLIIQPNLEVLGDFVCVVKKGD